MSTRDCTETAVTVTRLSLPTVVSREPVNKVVLFPDPRYSTHIRACTILGPGNETREKA